MSHFSSRSRIRRIGGERTAPLRGSVLLASIVIITIAGVAVVSWLAFITEGMRQAGRTRSHTVAFYAAEAGVERVVDYFNNPQALAQLPPATYDTYKTHPSDMVLSLPVQPAEYGVFEPYILDYAKNAAGEPISANGVSLWDATTQTVTNRDQMTLTRYTYFRDRAAGTPAAVSLTSKVVSMEIDVPADANLVMLDPDGREISRVVHLRIVHPTEIAPTELARATVRHPVVCKVIATGQSGNVRTTVEMMLSEMQVPALMSPAAIISEAAAEFSGNFNVSWGEVWSHDNVELDSDIMSKIPRLDPTNPNYEFRPGTAHPDNDPWFRLRTQGVFTRGSDYADGRLSTGFSPNQVLQLDNPEVYERPYDADFLTYINNKSDYENLENLIQNQSIEFPSYDYNQWRTFFMEYGLPYYWTDQSGNIYGRDTNPDSLTYNQVVSKSYDQWFAADPSSPDYNEYRQQFAFIDSVPVDNNGNPAPIVNGAPLIDSQYYPRPPSDPNAVVPTISANGNSLHTRGMFFVAANVDMNGQGNPPDSDDLFDQNGNPIVVMPDGSLPPSRNPFPFDVFHSGMLYSWGTISNGGNRTFYGSVYAEQGFAGSGSPSVFYNQRMKDGSWLNINQSRVRRHMWDVTNEPAAATM